MSDGAPVRVPVDDPDAVDRAAAAIADGLVVVIPTDTVYALGADATNPEAVERVRQLKGRPDEKAMAVMVGDPQDVATHAALDDDGGRAVRALLPGAVTLLLAPSGVPLACSEEKVGVRIPAHDFCVSLARRAGVPITATSANRSGRPEAHELDDALDLHGPIGSHVPVAVDGGTLPVGPPSTVIDLTVSPYRIVRHGALPAAEVDRLLGRSE